MVNGDALLSGLRVIDCSTYIAAPAAAVALSDFGADVIKIERPPYGDPYRYLGRVPGMPVSEVNYCWLLDNRNKRSVALNLGDPAGREVLLKLTSTADVFLTNYQPQSIRKLRLGYEDLAASNSRLIYASVTGYGETGGDAEKPGYDMTAYWARSGLMGLMHNAGSDPCQSPSGFGDHPTSMTLFAGILLALYRRERTGKGSKVLTSLVANGVWSNSCQVQAKLAGARFEEKRKRENAVNPLVNHYVTKDGQRFIFCCLDPVKDWTGVCRSLGYEKLIADPKFATPAARQANGAELIALIDAAVAARDMAEWTGIFRAHDVIWGPVPGMEQVAADAQLEANGAIVAMEHPTLGKIGTVSNPVNLEGVEKTAPRVAPGIGEHTAQVLRELGYAEDRIAEMARSGAVKI